MYKGVKNLPTIMLATADSLKTISSFYRKKLKGFNEYKVEGGILFKKHGPKKFGLVKDMKTYIQMPHVMIWPAKVEGGARCARRYQTSD